MPAAIVTEAQPRVRRARRVRGPQHQRGAALVTVVVVALVLVALLGGVAAHFGQTESRAVAASLLQVRAHWAMMGHVHYLRSRARSIAEGLDGDSEPTAADLAGAWNGNPDLFDAVALGLPCTDSYTSARLRARVAGGEPVSALAPEFAHCVLRELRGQDGSSGGLGLGGRCWSFPEYGLATQVARVPGGTLPVDAAFGAGAYGGVALRVQLVGIGTGLQAGASPPGPSGCGDLNAPPPFAAQFLPASPDRQVLPLNAGVFLGLTGNTIGYTGISDLWRARD